MATNSALSSAQIGQISGEFAACGNQVRGILNDPNLDLPPNVSNTLASDLTSLSNIGANFAILASQVIFADSDAAFTQISTATQSANAKVAQLKTTIGKINSIVNIVGSVISLGVAFGTGNFMSVLGAAANLGSAVANA